MYVSLKQHVFASLPVRRQLVVGVKTASSNPTRTTMNKRKGENEGGKRTMIVVNKSRTGRWLFFETGENGGHRGLEIRILKGEGQLWERRLVGLENLPKLCRGEMAVFRTRCSSRSRWLRSVCHQVVGRLCRRMETNG